MKNLKFGVFFLGLIGTVAALVAGVSAQGDRRPSARERGPAPEAFAFVAGGSQLGVRVSDVDAKTPSGGVHIDEVTAGSPAEKAGLKKGDIVVEFDGEKVRSARQFTRLVQETPDGRSVSIALMRDGKRQTLNATPESRMAWDGVGADVERALRNAERGLRNFHFDLPPQAFDFRNDDRRGLREGPRRFEYRSPDLPMPRMNGARGRLGVTVQSMTRDLEDYFGARNGGALVSSVAPESAAAKAGIKAGDVITSINGHSVEDSDDLMREVRNADGDATIVVLRDKKEMTLKAVLERAR